MAVSAIAVVSSAIIPVAPVRIAEAPDPVIGVVPVISAAVVLPAMAVVCHSHGFILSTSWRAVLSGPGKCQREGKDNFIQEHFAKVVEYLKYECLIECWMGSVADGILL